jgi:hypothetical protein
MRDYGEQTVSSSQGPIPARPLRADSVTKNPRERAIGSLTPSPDVNLLSSKLRRLSSSSRSDVSAFMLELQRNYGNRYVQRMIAISRRESDNPGVDPEIESGIQRKLGGGQGLDHGTRTRMESAFGSDFSGVRVHTDGESDHLNRAVSAVAFTTGQDIFFSKGAYAPNTSSGQELLAHELTHVVQQGGSRIQGKLVLGDPGDSFEQEAETIAKKVTSAPSGPIHRQCDCGGAADSEGECESCKKNREGAIQARSLQRDAASLPNMLEEEVTHSPKPVPNQLSASPVQDRTSSVLTSAGSHVVQRLPGDGMKPPGDCSPFKYVPLRAAVEAAKKVVNAGGKCRAGDSCVVLAGKIAAIATEIAARVALNGKCFKGGDTEHRGEVQARVNMMNNCYEYFVKNNCPTYLAIATASAVAAAGVAATKTTAEVAETATEVGEVIEGTEVAGESIEGGEVLVEALELLLLL